MRVQYKVIFFHKKNMQPWYEKLQDKAARTTQSVLQNKSDIDTLYSSLENKLMAMGEVMRVRWCSWSQETSGYNQPTGLVYVKQDHPPSQTDAEALMTTRSKTVIHFLTLFL